MIMLVIFIRIMILIKINQIDHINRNILTPARPA